MDRIFNFSVDNHEFETESQFLSGRQIKDMANVPLEYDLFLVVPEFDDELINNDGRVNFARPGVERFITRPHGSGITIIVNGVPCSHTGVATSISYEQVVGYAFPNAQFNSNFGYTVTYSYGPKENVEGILVKGKSVYTKNNMRFDVTATHKS